MAIAVPDELQESVGQGTNRAVTALRGSSMSVSAIFLQNIEPLRVLPAKHRASRYALERCLEGFAALDGHKSMPSRERMCPGVPWNGDCRGR